MNRQKAREEAFLMLCESGFDAERTADEIYETAKITRDVEEDAFTRDCLEGVIAHRAEIDEVIDNLLYDIHWNRKRITGIRSCLRIDCSVDSDQISALVDQGSATVSRIDGSISLDE